ncbi:MAG TPA: hypothetical protein VJ508_10435, partial [Saprospiraceae bacterium]|nr:hypothetical protein [Saprospiraceae bacterium]
MDYYNAAYARSIAFGGVLIVFLGFLFLYHALIREFHFWIVILALISVFLGTNLFHYTTREMSISHSYTFFLFAFLLWFLPRYFNRPDIWHSTLFGLVIGLIILIRPTNILVAAFVLGYEVYTWQALKHRLMFFLKNLKSL